MRRLSRAQLCLLVAALAILLGGFLWRFSHPLQRANEIRHVVLISIDTCRADRLGCYGFARQTTPHIDAIAREGVLFTRAHSTNPITLPAHSSMLTGTNPPYHGVHDNENYRLADGNLTLAEVLRDQGFQTAGFVSAFVLESRFGLDQGFETYDDQTATKLGKIFANERKAADVTREVIAWLDDRQDERFFLFVHYFDPHAPYVPPEPYASRFRDDPYDGEIAYTDCHIGQIIAKLKSAGLYDSTLLIITADHAESLGEHDEKTHSYFIYQSTIQVPLIVKTPGGVQGMTIEEPVSIVDVFPTVLGLIGHPVPSHVQGKDLSPYLLGSGEAEDERTIYCESLTATKYGCRPLHGLLDGPWKYIRTARPELYDLVQDPIEQNNLVDANPEMAAKLAEQLEQTLADQGRTDVAGSTLDLDSQSVERLRSLGYVGGTISSSGEVDEGGEDPKDFIALFNRLLRARALYNDGQLDEARRESLEILQQRPGLLPAHFILGNIARDERRFAGAVAHYSSYLARAAKEYDASSQGPMVRRDYDVAEVHNNLGFALQALDRWDEARTHYEEALRLQPSLETTHNNLGNLLHRQGNTEEAIVHLNEALRLKPNYAQPHVNLGEILLSQGQLVKAIAQFDAALQLEPDDPRVHSRLAEIWHKLDRPVEAIEHYRAALRSGRDDALLANNLAWLLATHRDDSVRNGAEAVTLAERINETLGSTEPTVLDTLAAAYADVGQFDAAQRTIRTAIMLAEKTNRVGLVEQLQGRLKLYEAQEPYRDPKPEK